MPSAEDIKWFKREFHRQIGRAAAGTPFSLDMLTAVACQETGYIWQVLRRQNLSQRRLLELCVGDTLDEDRGRRAFPRTKAALLAKPRGQEMFSIARQALVDIAQYIPDYRAAARRPNKFCHGFGIFQYDLQFFLSEPDYFLNKSYADFDACAAKAVEELRAAMHRIGWQNKTSLSEMEMAGVAIAYNTGTYRPQRGLKQGHFDGRKYYGEYFFDYLRLSKTVPSPGASPEIVTTGPGLAALPSPQPPVSSRGRLYRVDTRESTLRMRSEPSLDPKHVTENVISEFPDGHLLRAVKPKKVNGFLEVETSLLGAHYRGFVLGTYVKPITSSSNALATSAAAALGQPIPAVYMPRRPGTVTKRTQIAGAHSLNEPQQPGRSGETPEELRSELATIIDYLGVDNARHTRYRPRGGLTFCNIYAHDYCHLAGVYLPRVWWTPRAIELIARGNSVEPLYGNTIDEQRANDLFRWLRDFGRRFDWRRAATLSELQTEVNQGAIGLIVARRKQDGLSGHIVAVVPETEEHRAKRDRSGEVVAPLQSQAGAVNFRYGTSRRDWFKGDEFAESAFWLHA